MNCRYHEILDFHNVGGDEKTTEEMLQQQHEHLQQQEQLQLQQQQKNGYQ